MSQKSNVYDEMGVPTVINGVGTKTRVGGTLMREEAADAMREAATAFARISDLQAHASELISEVTGAEAGYVTTGAASGLTLAAAACIAGDDPGIMSDLPHTADVPREIVMPRAQRNSYDHALRASGAIIVDAGNNDRTLGPGSTNLEPWEFEGAISEETVGVAYAPGDPTDLSMIVDVAHENDLPVIVDAAGWLPPKGNLRRFVENGADIVVFSGGKAVRGPQSTGIVAGRSDLISSIALQHLDMDAIVKAWDPPKSLINPTAFDGVPRHGLGRGFKVGKEELVGLMRALELFVEEDTVARSHEWHQRAEAIGDALDTLDVLDVSYQDRTTEEAATTVSVSIDEEAAGITAIELISRLRRENPRVYVGDRDADRGTFTVNPMSLTDDDADTLIERVRATIVYDD
ncbi:MAG: aminotransferase class V-fold PLP-dependent enzyme [Halapricum sp.]